MAVIKPRSVDIVMNLIRGFIIVCQSIFDGLFRILVHTLLYTRTSSSKFLMISKYDHASSIVIPLAFIKYSEAMQKARDEMYVIAVISLQSCTLNMGVLISSEGFIIYTSDVSRPALNPLIISRGRSVMP